MGLLSAKHVSAETAALMTTTLFLEGMICRSLGPQIIGPLRRRRRRISRRERLGFAVFRILATARAIGPKPATLVRARQRAWAAATHPPVIRAPRVGELQGIAW